MSNMSYCRFRNTYSDLQDCFDAMEDGCNSEEAKARTRLIELCKRVVDNYVDEDTGKADTNLAVTQ